MLSKKATNSLRSQISWRPDGGVECEKGLKGWKMPEDLIEAAGIIVLFSFSFKTVTAFTETQFFPSMERYKF